jgi:hypothetical protein
MVADDVVGHILEQNGGFSVIALTAVCGGAHTRWQGIESSSPLHVISQRVQHLVLKFVLDEEVEVTLRRLP